MSNAYNFDFDFKKCEECSNGIMDAVMRKNKNNGTKQILSWSWVVVSTEV